MRNSVTEQTLKPGHLRGKLLLAMPNMGDPRFERAVICMCEHSEEGAMGIVINQPATHIEFPELMEQLNIPIPSNPADIGVFTGGPVEPNRGFVLHSADYTQDSSLVISEILAITATVEILRALAASEGPGNSLLALGYAGWEPGQLEAEMLANTWLNVPASPEMVFDTPFTERWSHAADSLGIDISRISSDAGHA